MTLTNRTRAVLGPKIDIVRIDIYSALALAQSLVCIAVARP